ncbi:MAG: hypothetical protein QW474_01630 [Candidatus Aenigmatarchaeota archaeon]
MAKRKKYDPTKERTRIITDEDLEETSTEEENPEETEVLSEAETKPSKEVEKAEMKPTKTNKIVVTPIQVPTLENLKIGDTIELTIIAKVIRKSDNESTLEIIDITTPTEEQISTATTPTSTAPEPTSTVGGGTDELAGLFT